MNFKEMTDFQLLEYEQKVNEQLLKMVYNADVEKLTNELKAIELEKKERNLESA